MPQRLILTIMMIIVTASTAIAQRSDLGILDHSAPDWQIQRWDNLEEGEVALSPSDFSGQVIYLYCFQSWCPGCHKYGFPTLQALQRRYADNPDVVFVAVQTVFEGFGSNTPEKGLATVTERYGLDIPVGYDTPANGGHGSGPLMRAYRSGGTPWTVIVDVRGVVRFNDFHLEPQRASALIDRLLEEGRAGR